MVVTAPIWVTFGLLASCAALCQSPDLQTSANTLPGAPSVRNESAQATAHTQSLRDVFDAGHFSVWERANVGSVTAGSAANFDLDHFDRQQPNENGAPDVLAKRIFASALSQSNSNQTSESETLIRRAGYAAASVVVTADDTGRRRLNTSYLLWVLTATAAHSAAANSAAAHNAYFPYWRRPLSSPAGNFGSTIGNDAGMNVFHEFKPGILQLVKSHEPRFVSAIGERFGKK